jgi:hypothetical protein
VIATSSTGREGAVVVVWVLMMVLAVVLLLVPFASGLGSIPQWTKIPQLLWWGYFKGRACEAGTERSCMPVDAQGPEKLNSR